MNRTLALRESHTWRFGSADPPGERVQIAIAQFQRPRQTESLSNSSQNSYQWLLELHNAGQLANLTRFDEFSVLKSGCSSGCSKGDLAILQHLTINVNFRIATIRELSA